jgi:hypothetical protein
VAWGRNYFGESDIPTNAVNVTAIAAGQLYSLAALQDGTVIGWGDTYYGVPTPPANVTHPLALYAGDDFALAWLRDPSSGAAPRLWRQPADQTVPGGNTLFLLPGINGTLPLRCQWYFHNSPLPGQTNLWLALPNANPTQSGGYWFVVTNDFGAVTSAVATVTVPPIVFTSQPTNVTAMMNTNVTLTATVAGTAPLSYRWQKNGQDLTDTNRMSGSASPTLAIASLIPSDAGSYRLVVTNPLYRGHQRCRSGDGAFPAAVVERGLREQLAVAQDRPGGRWPDSIRLLEWLRRRHSGRYESPVRGWLPHACERSGQQCALLVLGRFDRPDAP